LANKGIFSFCQYVEGKTVSLIGAGVSNIPLIPFLYSCGVKNIFIRDLKKKETDPEILDAKRTVQFPFSEKSILTIFRKILSSDPPVFDQISLHFSKLAKTDRELHAKRNCFSNSFPAKASQ
jgi:hypothetical protein